MSYNSLNDAVDDLGAAQCLQLIEWALKRKATEAKAGRRYRSRTKMIRQRVAQLAESRGLDVEEFLASDELAGFEHEGRTDDDD